MPADGVEAKLIQPTDAPNEQSATAIMMRNVNIPDFEEAFFLCMGFSVGSAVQNFPYQVQLKWGR